MFSLKKYLVYSVSILLLACSLSTSAVELLSDDRMVQEFSDGSNIITTPDMPFADFAVSYQNTTVEETEFSGSGSGYGESDFFFYIAQSTFDVTFGITVDTEFNLAGNFGGFPGDFGFSEVTVRLYDGADTGTANTIYSDSIQADFDFVEGDFAHDTTLTPGTYRLIITTNITPGGFGTDGYYSFTAALTESITDDDTDGIDDSVDNCTLVANADQTDTDGDGYGNACDADFNNDCVVNFLDIDAFANAFLGSNQLFDLNGDGSVNFLDYSLVTDQFLQTPGPGLSSGVCQD